MRSYVGLRRITARLNCTVLSGFRVYGVLKTFLLRAILNRSRRENSRHKFNITRVADLPIGSVFYCFNRKPIRAGSLTGSPAGSSRRQSCAKEKSSGVENSLVREPRTAKNKLLRPSQTECCFRKNVGSGIALG